MKLIDSDEAIINFGFEYEDIPPTQEEFVGFLKRQKTIDAVLVIHGEWGNYDEYNDGYRCSRCKLIHRTATKFCPHCGARMEHVDA